MLYPIQTLKAFVIGLFSIMTMMLSACSSSIELPTYYEVNPSLMTMPVLGVSDTVSGVALAGTVMNLNAMQDQGSQVNEDPYADRPGSGYAVNTQAYIARKNIHIGGRVNFYQGKTHVNLSQDMHVPSCIYFLWEGEDPNCERNAKIMEERISRLGPQDSGYKSYYGHSINIDFILKKTWDHFTLAGGFKFDIFSEKGEYYDWMDDAAGRGLLLRGNTTPFFGPIFAVEWNNPQVMRVGAQIETMHEDIAIRFLVGYSMYNAWLSGSSQGVSMGVGLNLNSVLSNLKNANF
jgi:hypothetical protein